MDGPLIVHMVLFVVVPLLWAYKRFFERVGPDAPGLQAYCVSQPLLAAVRVARAEEQTVRALLCTALGSRALVQLTLGNWPWTSQVISVKLSAASGVLRIHATGCRTRRTNETALPALIAVLSDLGRKLPLAPDATWLCEEAYGAVTGSVRAPSGWRLLPESTETFPLEPWQHVPDWVRAADARVNLPASLTPRAVAQ